MLQRQPYQARYEFEIPGITNEVCFADIRLANESNDEGTTAKLDHLQFQAQQGHVGGTLGFDNHVDIGEHERMCIPEPTMEIDDIDSDESETRNHLMLEEAFQSLTDR
ncbi:hypothetical protein KJZ99_11465 [bacterium]|nr:hypothetical protein [bacterium]